MGDSISLAKIGNSAFFTVLHIDDSDYLNGDQVTKGVKITTKEYFEIDGHQINKFHTTRVAIVNKFANEKLRADVNSGKSLGPVKCISDKTKQWKKLL